MKSKTKIPTIWQARSLEQLVDGWKLIDNIDRIYWEKHLPGRMFSHTIECDPPKRKRYFMKFMERYGWINKGETEWVITNKGREALERYKNWIK